MTLLSPWALAGLLLVVPLILAHVRRRRPPVRDVGSLLEWRALSGAGAAASRSVRPPLRPLLLVLQVLVVVAIVLALARPVGDRATPPPTRIVVVDDSPLMGIAGRAAAARQVVARARAATPGDRVAVIRTADLPLGIERAGALRATAADRVLLVRAPEDRPPLVTGSGTAFSDTVVGHGSGDQALTGATARCGLATASGCEILARVRNLGSSAHTDRVQAIENGRAVSTVTVTVPARGAAPVAFSVPAGSALELRLAGRDALAADDVAYVAAPATRQIRITLVGRPATATALARALASVPDVALRLRRPATYRRTDPATSDLVVFDDFVPSGGLPASPGVVFVAPPRLPGGAIEGTLRDSRLSGSVPGDPLLEGVDLSALTIAAHGARRITALPAGLSASAWSADGPLLAAGTLRGRRVAVLAFGPSDSNLSQLASFPALVANLVAFSQDWAPTAATAGRAVLAQQPPGTTAASISAPGSATRVLTPVAGTEQPLTVARPGLVTLRIRGPWGTRTQAMAVNAPAASAPQPATVDLGVARGAGSGARGPWWPWLLAAALALALVASISETGRPVRAGA